MAASYKIEFSLRGPDVVQWIDEYLSQPAVGAARVIRASAYEGFVTWTLPVPDAEQPQASVRLLAQAVQAFREHVPGGAELLKTHQSDVRVEITGGPR